MYFKFSSNKGESVEFFFTIGPKKEHVGQFNLGCHVVLSKFAISKDSKIVLIIKSKTCSL